MFSKRKVRGYSAVLAGLGRALAMKKKSTGKTKATTKSIIPTKYKAKRRTGGTVTRRRNTKETDVPGAEFTKQTVSLGLNKPRQVAMSKFVRDNISKNIYSYRTYSQFGGLTGNIGLLNVSPTTSTGPFQVPLNLWELTSSPNIVNGTITYPAIRWAPVFSTPLSSATLSWTNDGTLSIENADNATSYVQNMPSGSSHLNWVKAKMLFYAPTTVPCRFQIDIVQFKDTRLVPDASTGISDFARSFYQAMVKRFAFSPLEDGDTKYQKYMKVLYTNSFILNPKESTESVNTILRQVDIFLRLNRRCTYDWEDNDGMNVLTLDGQTNTGVNNKLQVHPRARIFMIIRAQAQNSTAYSATVHPSYELVLKTAHSQLNG